MVYVDGQILAEPGYGQNITELNMNKLISKNGHIYQKTISENDKNILSLNNTITSPQNFSGQNIIPPNTFSSKLPEIDTPLKNILSTSSSTITSLLPKSPKQIQPPPFGSFDLMSNQLSKRIRQQSLTSNNENSEFNEKYFQQQQQSIQQQTTQYLTAPSLQIDIPNQQQSSSSVLSPNNTSATVNQLTSFFRSNLITVDGLRKDVLHKLFNLAHDLRILVLTDKDLTSLLRGKVIAEMFFEPSTRTQC